MMKSTPERAPGPLERKKRWSLVQVPPPRRLAGHALASMETGRLLKLEQPSRRSEACALRPDQALPARAN